MNHIKVTISILIILSIVTGHSQQILEVEGAIQLASTPVEGDGTIRWTGTDFEGWNGVEWVSLTQVDFITDIENNDYDIVTIGGQTWMSDNLRVTRFNDGTPIALVTDEVAWAGLTSAAYTWYDNAPSPYGALYNWYAADAASNGGRNVCPAGWRVPTDAEFSGLVAHLGGASIAGGKLKESGLSHWQTPNTAATNDSGFAALPAGYRKSDGTFRVAGRHAYWWTSTENSSNTTRAWYQFVNYDDDNVDRNNMSKKLGFPLRCIKE